MADTASTLTGDFMSRRQLADMLKIKRLETLTKHIKAGELPPPVVVGQRHLFDRAEVLAKLQKNREEFLGGE